MPHPDQALYLICKRKRFALLLGESSTQDFRERCHHLHIWSSLGAVPWPEGGWCLSEIVQLSHLKFLGDPLQRDSLLGQTQSLGSYCLDYVAPTLQRCALCPLGCALSLLQTKALLQDT